jgi:hypothetical protein
MSPLGRLSVGPVSLEPTRSLLLAKKKKNMSPIGRLSGWRTNPDMACCVCEAVHLYNTFFFFRNQLDGLDLVHAEAL